MLSRDDSKRKYNSCSQVSNCCSGTVWPQSDPSFALGAEWCPSNYQHWSRYYTSHLKHVPQVLNCCSCCYTYVTKSWGCHLRLLVQSPAAVWRLYRGLLMLWTSKPKQSEQKIKGRLKEVWCGAVHQALRQVSPWPHLLHASLQAVVAFSTVTCYHQSQEK